MTRLARIADAATLYAWLEEYFNLGVKRPGTEPGRRAEEFVAGKLREFGIEDVRLDPIPMLGWEADRISATLAAPDGRTLDVPVEPVVYCPLTGPEGKRYTLARVGSGGARELEGVDGRGKAAVLEIDYGSFTWGLIKQVAYASFDPEGTLPDDYTHIMTWMTSVEEEVQERLKEKGFEAVLFLMPYDITPWVMARGAVPHKGVLGDLTAALVRRSDGRRLLEAMGEGFDSVHLTLAGRSCETVTHNVLGRLPGASDDVVTVTTHHDAMWNGAVEEGSGVSVVLALARHFAGLPREKRKKTLWFNILAGEQHKVIGGVKLMERHQDDIFRRLITDVHIEHIAREVVIRDGRPVVTGQLQPRAIFVSEERELLDACLEMAERFKLARLAVLPTANPLGVQTDAIRFVERGVPVISFISAPPTWNAREDTLEKVPPEELARVAEAFAWLVGRVSEIDGAKMKGRVFNQSRLPPREG